MNLQRYSGVASNPKSSPSLLELQAKELRGESIEERRRDREENERRQATQIAAWMLVEREDEGGRREVDVDDLSSFDRASMHVCEVVQNASESIHRLTHRTLAWQAPGLA